MVRRFLVQGRVQGVGFRWFVHREAAEIGLRGWVKNTEDGDVEVVASGSYEELSALRSTLHRGSRGSRVDRIIEQELTDDEADGLRSFQIEGAW
jgi:acylphosphatase